MTEIYPPVNLTLKEKVGQLFMTGFKGKELSDQEGGTVVQFKEIAATFTSHMGIAATGNTKNAEIAGRIIGEAMNSCGIDGIRKFVDEERKKTDRLVIHNLNGHAIIIKLSQ